MKLPPRRGTIPVKVNRAFFNAKSRACFSPDNKMQKLKVMKGKRFAEVTLARLAVYSFIEFR